MITELLTKSFDDILDVEYTREPRGRSRQDRAGQDRLREDARRASTRSSRRTSRAPARRCIEPQGRASRSARRATSAARRCSSKVGKFGPFIACSGYPDCTNTRELETSEPESETGEEEIEPCENCGKPMVVKRGRFGQFLACTGYPECKTTRKLIATKQGGLRAAKAGSDSRREVPAVRVEPRRQAGPVRRVHRVHEAIPSASTSSTRRPA